MKFGLMIAGLLGVGLLTPAMATTLKLSPDIDLLVVDGKQMTGSLLKGADSLELNGGQHQLLFKVAKTVKSGSRDQALYTSAPLIVAFNSQNINSVSIELPRIDNERDSQRFDDNLNYQIIDNQGKKLITKHDTLSLNGISVGADLEKAMTDYNGQNHPASVPAFAQPHSNLPIAPPATSSVPQKSVTLKGENVAEQMLQYWFQQADKTTQKRFLSWANQRSN